MNLIKLIVLPVIFLPILLSGLLILALEDEPKLKKQADMTPARIARVKQLIQMNDPRRLRSGAVVMARLRQEELDLAVNYFANQYAQAVAGLVIEKGRAIVEATVTLPANPFGRFINVKLEIKQTQKLPLIERLQLGNLPIPAVLANNVVNYLLANSQTLFDWQEFNKTVRHIRFEPRQLVITYQWRTDLPARLSGILLSPQELSQIEFYQRRLAELTQKSRPPINLTDLMQPLFSEAKERSQNGEAVKENRAVILVLAFYANQKNLSKLISQSKTWSRPNWRSVKLQNREDLTKHYLVSALLAAYAGTPLADAVGLYKEIEDSKGGSGFSFIDIAADRAGTLMGELAVAGEQQARQVQSLLATGAESDIMPKTSDLPEFISEAEFMRRYGGTQGKAYQQMMNEIERRILALPVNRS
ncbi:MAG: hypothetical protein Q7U98_17665 [Methylicorpusculum sp.]|uniref:hypothetical protein n=1 Tax=Methylicorpusculum sp. TaxID=2713644 RepID=UPI002724F708|nr:hypothetical protein [Methylicorpusculum sp.]MDO8940986.1 hypothetical protein [Methylicorpusculum sp.]MDP2200879.1 hypothetical protein [Methylicorpusculum sp.]